jgi:hypothetical protein
MAVAGRYAATPALLDALGRRARRERRGAVADALNALDGSSPRAWHRRERLDVAPSPVLRGLRRVRAERRRARAGAARPGATLLDGLG